MAYVICPGAQKGFRGLSKDSRGLTKSTRGPTKDLPGLIGYPGILRLTETISVHFFAKTGKGKGEGNSKTAEKSKS